MKKIGSRVSLSALPYGWTMFNNINLFLLRGFLAVIDCFALGSFFAVCLFVSWLFLCFSGCKWQSDTYREIHGQRIQTNLALLVYIQIHQRLVWLQRLCWHSFDYGHHENFDVEQLRPLRHMEGFLKLLHLRNMQSGLLHRVIRLPRHMRLLNQQHHFPSSSCIIFFSHMRLINQQHHFSLTQLHKDHIPRHSWILNRLLYLRNMQIGNKQIILLARLLYMRNMQIRFLTRLLYLRKMQICLLNRLLHLSNIQSGLLTLPRLLCLLQPCHLPRHMRLLLHRLTTGPSRTTVVAIPTTVPT